MHGDGSPEPGRPARGTLRRRTRSVSVSLAVSYLRRVPTMFELAKAPDRHCCCSPAVRSRQSCSSWRCARGCGSRRGARPALRGRAEPAAPWESLPRIAEPSLQVRDLRPQLRGLGPGVEQLLAEIEGRAGKDDDQRGEHGAAPSAAPPAGAVRAGPGGVNGLGSNWSSGQFGVLV